MSDVFDEKVKRREDARLVTGRGRFTDDIQLPGMLFAAILRSPHAHARIVSIDVEKAVNQPGVVAIYTGKDLEEKLGTIPAAWLQPGLDIKPVPHHALAVDRVRYTGDGVALVIAETRYGARDALDFINVTYEVLPGVVNQEEAMGADAPLLHDDAPGNVAFHWRAGNATDEAFEQAEVVVKHRIRQQGLVPNPLETRSAVAEYNPATGEMTMWFTSQNPHIHRFILSGVLGVPEHKLRIIPVDVDGGFGSKTAIYPDVALVGFAARDLGRPVKWTEDRREHFLATTYGWNHIEDVEIAGRKDGTIEAIRVRTLANMGAYLSTEVPGVPTILSGLIVPGPYKIPYASVDVYGVFTNTTQIDAYRGAGRSEATYLLERMVELFANEIGMDPVAVRRKNLIQKEDFPYHSALGFEYDSGNYELALNRALDMADYYTFRKHQQKFLQGGKLVGVGVTTYVEICGLGPSQVADAAGDQFGSDCFSQKGVSQSMVSIHDLTLSFGTHICMVEVDRDTGEVKVDRYVAVDDCGRVLNPLLAGGQFHGGIVQGIGGTGTIATTPTVVNAVLDALKPFGVRDIDVPLTPEKVWRAMESGGMEA